MSNENKIIFVGPENIHSAFAQMGQYNFQEPIISLEEFQHEMRLDENKSKVSRSSSAIIFFSRLYTGAEKEFAKLVAFYAPYAVVSILIPEQDKELIPRMESLIRAAKRENASNSGGSYDALTPTFFISYEAPMPDLTQAMADFIADETISPDVKPGVMEMLPEHYKSALSIENNFEMADETLEELYGNDDSIVIPKDDEDKNGVVIAVTSSKGGSGKSTVSMLLAAYLAKASKISEQQNLERRRLKVCVIDFDTRDGQLGFLNGQTSPTVFNIIGDSNVVGNEIPRSAIEKGIYSSSNIEADFIFAPRRTRHAKEIKPQFYVSIIHELKGMYDYIILDTSVNYLDVLLEEVAYPMSDKIILVTDMGISSIMGMARWITETTSPKEKGGSGIDKNKIGITVNKVMDGVNMGADRIKKTAMGVPIIAMLPNAPKLITFKANTNSLDDVLYKRQINQSFKVLANSIVGDSYQLADVPYNDD
ncbi:MAG TPA: AAA family ATPase [Clostridiales bacterium]|nr:AAA family ATPase [Clostridiales bacterium]